MSKNLEKEYKDYIQSEAPDLWERIEAGLTEKKAGKEENPKTVKAVMPETTGNETVRTKYPGKQKKHGAGKKGNRKYVVAGGSLAAAVLVVLLVSPILKDNLLFAGGTGKSSSDMAAMDMASGVMEEGEQAEWDEAEAVPAEMLEAEEYKEEINAENTCEVKERLFTILEKTETDQNTVYYGETESGEGYTFLLAEDAAVDEEVVQEGGLSEGKAYRISLKREGEVYVATAIQAMKD